MYLCVWGTRRHVSSISSVRRHAWNRVIARQPRVTVQGTYGQQIHYIQTTKLLRFKDDVTIEFFEAADRQSTLAIYSASRTGWSDMGVNKKRVTAWLEELSAELTKHPAKL